MQAFIRLGRMAQALVIATIVASEAYAQSTTGTIQGSIRDEQGAVIPGATVTIRNVDTNFTRSVVSGADGAFRFPNLPVGDYTLVVDLTGFGRYTQEGIRLLLNQDAVAEVTLRPAAVAETVTVRADTPLLNTTNAEVGVRFDSRRISELPVGNSRDIFTLALPAAGGQPARIGAEQLFDGHQLLGQRRPAAFEQHHARRAGQQRPERDRPSAADQQHRHRPGSAAHHQPVLRRVRPGGRVGDERHHQERHQPVPRVGVLVPQRQQPERADQPGQDRRAAPRPRPSTRTRSAFTLGGPVFRDRTFFFGSYQNWRQKFLGSGFTLNGAPTEEGRSVLQSAVGSRPQIAALLNFLPAAQTRDRHERDVHGQRPDLRRAAGLAYRLLGGGVRQRPDLGANRPAVGAEQPARRPLHVR